jgi:gluconokinase
MSPLTKLLWIKETMPDLFARAFKFVSIKEYVIFHLFGQWVVDVSVASASGMLSLNTGDWDEGALRLAGVETSRLSQPVPCTYTLRGLRSDFAERMGIDPATPFAIGGSDGALANMGVGATRQGELAVTIGTSGAARMIVDKGLTDTAHRTFCYTIDGKRRLIGGPTNNGGIVLRWIRDRWGYDQEGLSGDLIYERMTVEAAAVPAGAEGLIFLPYLLGERAPIWNSNAKGTMYGLTLQHGREHMVRAAMEGVTMGVASVAKVLAELTGSAQSIRASGGFAASPLWLQMLADIMDAEVEVPDVHEASALGAAILALCAIGELNDWTDMKDNIRITDRYFPNPELRSIYSELFERFISLYAALAPSFENYRTLPNNMRITRKAK